MIITETVTLSFEMYFIISITIIASIEYHICAMDCAKYLNPTYLL